MATPALISFLESHNIPYRQIPHPTEISAQHLAASVRESGWHVAKSVLVEADGKRWLVVMPAPERIDPDRLLAALDAMKVRVLDESAVADVFRDCELGAEPPFGSLYGIPVLMDECLSSQPRIVFRAGSHQEAIEIATDAYRSAEHPKVAAIGMLQRSFAREASRPSA